MSYTKQHLAEAARVVAGLDIAVIERMAHLLVNLRTCGGRLFFLGVGKKAFIADRAKLEPAPNHHKSEALDCLRGLSWERAHHNLYVVELSRDVLRVRQSVAVDRHRESWCCMPEHFGHNRHRDTVSQQQRRCCVAKVVEPHCGWETCLTEQRP